MIDRYVRLQFMTKTSTYNAHYAKYKLTVTINSLQSTGNFAKMASSSYFVLKPEQLEQAVQELQNRKDVLAIHCCLRIHVIPQDILNCNSKQRRTNEMVVPLWIFLHCRVLYNIIIIQRQRTGRTLIWHNFSYMIMKQVDCEHWIC